MHKEEAIQGGRNRASHARLVKLNKSLEQPQRDLIESYFLGGMLKIEARQCQQISAGGCYKGTTQTVSL